MVTTRSQTRRLAEKARENINLSRNRCCVCGAVYNISGPLPFPHKTLTEWNHTAINRPIRKKKIFLRVIKAREVFPSHLTRLLKRRRKKRKRVHMSRTINLDGNATVGRAEPALSEDAIRFMLELSIPTLPPHCDWTQVECLKHLNWEISLTWAVDSLELSNRSNAMHSSLTAHDTVHDHSSSRDIPSPPGRFPFTNEPAMQHRGSDLEQERRRMRDRMLHGSFQIPSDWTPLRSIYPPEDLDIREGTLNSALSEDDSPPLDMDAMFKRLLERGKHGKRHRTAPLQACPIHISANVSPISIAIAGTQSSDRPSVPVPWHPDSDPLDHTVEEDQVAKDIDAFWKRLLTTEGGPENKKEIDDAADATKSKASLSPYQEPVIKFAPKLHGYLPSLIHDWEMLIAMKHYSFIWRYQEPEAMRSRARFRHVRVFSTSRPLLNLDINLPGATARMIALRGGDMSTSRETGNRYVLGQFLANMISTETMPAYCSFRKKTLPGWQCPSTPVLLDVACIPSREVLQWDERAAPLLLAAQFSEGVGGHDRMAADPLACAFHSTLIVLILYYLDTRLEQDDKLPSWMVVYGIIYTETGFSIHEHYPVYHPPVTGQPARWGAASALAVNFEYAFDPHSPPQSQPVSALLRVCGHAQFTLETLTRWDGYQRMIVSHFMPQKTSLTADE